MFQSYFDHVLGINSHYPKPRWTCVKNVLICEMSQILQMSFVM